SRASGQPFSFSQSNAGSADREPSRCVSLSPCSRSATLRPVFPVPPTTNVISPFMLVSLPVQGCLVVQSRTTGKDEACLPVVKTCSFVQVLGRKSVVRHTGTHADPADCRC